MIQDFSTRISHARQALQNNDFDYGFRLFIDCVLDTNDYKAYSQCVDLVAKNSQNKIAEKLFSDEIIAFLNKLVISKNEGQKENLLKVENISRSYGDGKFQLKDITLNLAAGEIVGIVGENGNGKTTLLRILAKELSKDFGEISYKYDEVEAYDARTKLIYIPQRTSVWHGSLYDNLKFTAANYGVRGEKNQILVDMIIIRFGLWDYRNLNWSELSSGYKMRFELARIFLRRPKILLLDEPLGNLDVKSQQIILEDLKSLAKSPMFPIGIILSSQQLFEVEKSADKILFLQKGELKHEINKNTKNENTQTIVEMEVKNTDEEVRLNFNNYPNLKISFNGGIYTIELEEVNGYKKILEIVSKSDLNVLCLRDISNSTRRFFI